MAPDGKLGVIRSCEEPPHANRYPTPKGKAKKKSHKAPNLKASRPPSSTGGAPATAFAEGGQKNAKPKTSPAPVAPATLESVLDKANMTRAWERVMQQGGEAGWNEQDMEAVRLQLYEHWNAIKDRLRRGEYVPPDPQMRSREKKDAAQLDFAQWVNRMLQQAVLQVLIPAFNPDFSWLHDGQLINHREFNAVKRLRRDLERGQDWVMFADLTKMFCGPDHRVFRMEVVQLVKDASLRALIQAWLSITKKLEQQKDEEREQHVRDARAAVFFFTMPDGTASPDFTTCKEAVIRLQQIYEEQTGSVPKVSKWKVFERFSDGRVRQLSPGVLPFADLPEEEVVKIPP